MSAFGWPAGTVGARAVRSYTLRRLLICVALAAALAMLVHHATWTQDRWFRIVTGQRPGDCRAVEAQVEAWLQSRGFRRLDDPPRDVFHQVGPGGNPLPTSYWGRHRGEGFYVSFWVDTPPVYAYKRLPPRSSIYLEAVHKYQGRTWAFRANQRAGMALLSEFLSWCGDPQSAASDEPRW